MKPTLDVCERGVHFEVCLPSSQAEQLGMELVIVNNEPLVVVRIEISTEDNWENWVK